VKENLGPDGMQTFQRTIVELVALDGRIATMKTAVRRQQYASRQGAYRT
jgi:hypothetical protein